MNIKLFFIFTLLISNVNAYCSCEDIIESIEICKEYSCRQYIGNEDFIEHKILGLNSGNLCVYIEKQGDDEMVCHHSQYGMMIEKFNLRSSRAAKEEVSDNFNCKVVSLDSILYLSPDTWKIWVSGKLFINTKDLKVHSVTENCVTFVWDVDQKAIKKHANDSQNVYLGQGSVMFTLYPKQKFDLDSLSIK